MKANLLGTNSPLPTWRESVISALRRYSHRHNTCIVTRQGLISEELPQIEDDVATIGLTPGQTLSRVLQELRDEGFIEFLGQGQYLFLEQPVPVENEDLPDDALEKLVSANKLVFGEIETGDIVRLARQRLGQTKVRHQTLINYSHQCAFCGVRDESFLVAAHISLWKEDRENRGNLANIICMCRPHDALFEVGYFALTDTYEILRKPHVDNDSIGLLLAELRFFRAPIAFPPDPFLLRKHRQRCGLQP
jgi:hypothetical protein